MGDSLGYSNKVIRDNPTVPELPMKITDFCSPLESNTTLFGLSGGEGEIIPIAGDAPELGLGCINWAGTNLIGVNNDPGDDSVDDDGCWVVTDWCGDDIDNDGDTTADEMCRYIQQRNPNNNVGGVTGGIYGTASHLIGTYSESYRDADGDGFSNDVDACPYIFSTNVDNTYGCDGCPPDTCTHGDHDGDTYLNRQDRCPFVTSTGADVDRDYIGTECDTDSGTATPPAGDSAPDGAYVNTRVPDAACIGDTDTDVDGWCDTTEDIVGHGAEVLSDKNNVDSSPEYKGIDYPIDTPPYDDDGDTVADEDPVDGSDNDADTLTDEDPPLTAPGTCTDQAYYDTAGPGGAELDNDGDDPGDGSKTNANEANCATIPSDDDQDGVPNGSDNCQAVPNPEQLDTDGDGAGDACEGEDDADGRSDIDEWKCGQNAKSACDPFDTNDDNGVNVLDILLFKPELGGTNPVFNHNCDGAVNVLDILLYKPVLAGSKPCPYQYGYQP